MSTIRKSNAHKWRRNALFRVLAFLDSTGEQSFSLAADVDDQGNFTHPELLFADTTAIHAILAAGLVALRENVKFLFADEAEKEAVLCVVGTGTEETGRETEDPSASTDAQTAAAGDVKNAAEERSKARRVVALPCETRWSRLVMSPKGLANFPVRFCGDFTLNLLYRLEEVMRVPGETWSDSPLVEQFFIDALDQWMDDRAEADNHRMVLACGLQPAVLEAATAQKDAVPFALTDFVIDVLFPDPVSSSMALQGGEGDNSGNANIGRSSTPSVEDWLVLTYQHNHETVDLEAESSASAVESGSDGGARSPAAQRARHEEDEGLHGWQPDSEEEGSVTLTADNIDRYMRECPDVIPVEVLREKRTPWKSPTITRFELEHHYALSELKAAVRELALLDGATGGAVAAWETAAAAETTYKVGSLTPSTLKAAARATKKAEIISVLLALHGATADDKVDMSDQHESASPAESPSIADGAFSAAQLVKLFSLNDLQSFIEKDLGEEKAPATKKKCANVIVAKRRAAKP